MRLLITFLIAMAVSPAYAQEPSPDRIRAAIRSAGGPKNFIANMNNAAAKMVGNMIDDQTQLTAVAAIDLASVYYIKLVGIERSTIPDLEKARSTIAKGNARSVCTAPIAKILISEYGAEYRYMVYSNSGEYLFQYSYDAAKCAAYTKQ